MPVLLTRLYKPLIKEHYVTRSKILDYLDLHGDNSLTLVVAPAGYGKSVTISQWLERNGSKYGWISLDNDCNDLRVFVNYLVNGIQITYPSSLKNIQDLGNVMDLPAVKVISNLFINEITKLKEDFALVLDDYHLISNQQIHDLINEFLKYPTDKLKLFILSRRDPPLKLSSFKAYDQVNEIRMSELRFDENEVIDLSKMISSHPIDPDTASVLVAATEGWIIGLRLAIQSIIQGRELKVVLSNLGNEKLVVTQFLMDEIIHPQTEFIRECFFRASILSRFCEGLLREICSDDGIQDNLKDDPGKGFFEEITGKTLFIIPLDADNIWFRFHHLFGEILQKQMEKRYNPEQISAFHRKASQWLERNGYFSEAIEHAIKAGDFKLADQIIENQFKDLFDNEKLSLMDRWLKMFPAEAMNNFLAPNLILAFICDLNQDYSTMDEALNRAYKILSALSPDDNLNDSQWGYYYSLKTLLLYKTGKIQESQSSSALALKFLEGDNSLLRDSALLYNSFGLIAAGKWPEADQKVFQYRALIHSHDQLGLARNSLVVAYVSFFSGNLTRIYNVLSPVIEFYKDKSYNATRGMVYYYLGFVDYERNHLDESIRWFDTLWEHRFSSLARWILHHLYIKALALKAKGEKAELTDLMDNAHQYVDELGLPSMDQFLACIEVEMALYENDFDRIEQYDYKAYYDYLLPYCFYYVPQLTRVKLKIKKGGNRNFHEAQTELGDIIEYLRKTYNINLLIQALTLQALLFKLMGDVREALTSLSEALDLARPGGFIRVFVDMGKEIRDLILYHKNYSDDPYIIEILEAFHRELPPVVSKSNHGKTIHKQLSIGNTEHLTTKEIEILKLLSEGYQNKEIADQLFHSLGTIKNYVYNIYHKLGARNRTNAISIARASGLLPSDTLDKK